MGKMGKQREKESGFRLLFLFESIKFEEDANAKG